MEKVFYTENSVSEFPSSVEVYNHLRCLRNELDLMEGERDIMLALLHEVSEADDLDSLEEVLGKVREFVEGRPYPPPY